MDDKKVLPHGERLVVVMEGKLWRAKGVVG